MTAPGQLALVPFRRAAFAVVDPEHLQSPFASLTDEQAREELEQLLRLRRRAAANPGAEHSIGLTVLRHVGLLAEGVAGWAAAIVGGTLSREAFERLPVERRRGLVATHLQFAPLLQPGTDVLIEPLLALNGGQVDPQLTPSRARGFSPKGIKPHRLLHAHLAVLCWIEWQVGQGRSLTAAQGEALGALGLKDVSSFWQWKKQATIAFGEAHVRGCLEESQNCSSPSYQSPALRRHLNINWFGLQSWPIERLAAAYNDARAARSRAKSRVRSDDPGRSDG